MVRSSGDATAADVAQLTGVSKWTVIRAFKADGVIAEETRRRVLDAAARLNYRPNLLARSLATRRTELIGILIDDFDNPFKLPTLRLLTAALQREGMLALVINVNEDLDHGEALSTAWQRRLDAVVLFGTDFEPETLAGNLGLPAGLPCYVLTRDSSLASLPSISCDDETAIAEVQGHFVARRYRRPGFLSGPTSVSSLLRRKGPFIRLWAERGIEVQEIVAHRYNRVGAEDAIRAYLEAEAPSRRVDCLMCENDTLAIGAMDVIRHEFGLGVPGDIAVAGFDGIDLAAAAAYDLTTIQQPEAEMVDRLVDMLQGRAPPRSLRLPGRLLVRSST